MIYLDNNATTIMPAEVRKMMLKWCNRGNPSASYASAQESRAMMTLFRDKIGKICGFNPCCVEERDQKSPDKSDKCDPKRYKIIFTSGASEANCTVLRSVMDSYAEITGKTPHIVMSSIEHKSLLEAAKSYEVRNLATVTFVKPTTSGHIKPEDVESAITPNTCIVCVMHANNETGAINDIKQIGAIAHKHNVPFHCDTVQTFGKYPINPIKDNVDSFCVSFHKLHGPPGTGALIIKQQLVLGYKLCPLIFGSQNDGMRGGTENLPGLGASMTAFDLTMTNRHVKNQNMLKFKAWLMKDLSIRFKTQQYTNYVADRKKDTQIVFLSGVSEFYLPNTILLSVIKTTGSPICNVRIKTELEKKSIVVSVGSACNTASAKASHVLYSMNADVFIRKGALRISMSDETTLDEIKKFVDEFSGIVMYELNRK